MMSSPPRSDRFRIHWLASLLAICIIGCGTSEPYSPPERTAEEEQQAAELSSHRADFQRAMRGSSGDYALVAVLDRNYRFEDDSNEYARVLVLHREQLDLDDYSFARPGQEESEDGDLMTVMGTMFWITEDGEIIFDDFEQPPGSELVVEWFVQNDVPQASLHFGGNPCLTVTLSE